MLNIHGYTLLGALHATGANVLLHAVREADGANVVLKTPLGLTPGSRERYRREYSILQRLRGIEGVARAQDYEVIHERPVLLLEVVSGQPLSKLVGAPFDIARFLELAIALASTLEEIHLRDVIHKDIKPSNIIITPSGEPRIIDFGAATLQQIEHVDPASSQVAEGTLPYMSPEQTGRMNRSVDSRADLYSLGVSFYELLTGERPFQGKDVLEWFHAHMAQVARPPHERVASIPPVLSAIVLKLLSKTAEERYQSAEGLRADLERCREGLRRGALELFPLGTQDLPRRFQVPQRLYGRTGPVDTLLQGVERVACGGRAELILVSGYSGIGKSAVVNELHKPVVRRRGLFLSGKFDQLQRDVPYATLAQAIRGLVQQLLSGSDASLALWRERLNQAWGRHGQVMVELVPQLELIAGKQPPVPELPPAEAQHRLNRVFRGFLGVLAPPEHPLVVFLDDLQWADLASLQLLQHLLTEEDSPPVLLVGAYRDHEVSPSHPLAVMLGVLRKAGARVTDILLEPLSLEHVQQLVTDALPGAEPEAIAALSSLIREKTGGNPFFLLQLLMTLHQDGLLRRTPHGRWQWDAAAVQARGYSENVVDFMVGKLRQLSGETRHLLRLAACLGNRFPLELLTCLSGMSAGQVEQDLEQALQEGLLMRGGPEQYRFLHDRIQQAAYSLVDEEERQVIHLRIGRLLLASLPPERVHEKLFELVGQFNASLGLLTDPEERHHIARLNAQAGWKARASIAHGSALHYFQTAIELLPGDPWRTDRELTFKVRLDQASSELLSGNAARACGLSEELLAHARTHPELAAASCLKCDTHLAVGEIHHALACLLDCLARMGMPLPARPTWEQVVAAHDEVWSLLGDRPIDSLLELPLMTDPDKRAMMNVLATLFAPAYFSDNHLLTLYLCKMVSLSLRHGNTEAAAHGYGWFGVVLGFFFKRYQEGYAFGELARRFVDRYKLDAFRGKVLFSLKFIAYWTQPLSRVLELLVNAFEAALQVGDFQIAAYCSNLIVTVRLIRGHNLDDVHQELLVKSDFMRKSGFLDVQDIFRFTEGYLEQLRGRSRGFHTMNSKGFDEASFEASLSADRMTTMRVWYWLTKLQSRFMCGAYDEALEAREKAAELAWAMLSALPLLDLHFYGALALASSHERADAERQRRYLEAIQGHHQQLAEWASVCPESFRSHERLVSAELARLGGRTEEAMAAYEEALRAAREHGFTQVAGLACELAASFYSKRRIPTLAEAYALKAREAYLQWGACGKVQQLDTLWPHLVPEMAASSALTTTTTDTGSTRVDALTLVKVQQALSSEIVLERLVSTLVQVAIENAGAQRGVLLLLEDDRLTVAVDSRVTRGGAGAGPEEATPSELPWTLVAYVKRAHEHVLIGDVSAPHPFSSDGYLQHGRARSVLCLPLVRKEVLYGVLYLEHNLATNAFPPARLALLGHLASQAAISIENARLYAEVQRAGTALRHANDELERRVEERTRELKETQSQLVDIARAAGMSEIASNVLHSVGNVLTSAVLNLEQMRQAVGASRISRVQQLSRLFEEHRESLVEFLTQDPRGKRLPDYTSALASVLLREQEQSQQNLEAMCWHIEHIRAIVQVQQTYAKTTLLLEACDLSKLIEDAIRIQTASLQRHGISVMMELSPVAPVRVDKHKVLQILINLLSNAKHAMDEVPPEQRQLRVRLTAEGKRVLIQVVDTGMGIAPEARERLFSHGFTTRKEGHGFGLHSSALAANLLGGRLQLESEGPGKGATATLELPLSE